MTVTHELCRQCEQFPCQCDQRGHATNWLIQHCATPGCFTAIRVRAEHSLVTPICKWCDQDLSHAKHGKPAVDIRLKPDYDPEG